MVDLPERNRIVGRAAELSLLDYLVASVADGRGGMAWVQGEPGAGKSTLIDAALAPAAALGCEVLRGAGNELMQPFPLRLMADCLGISVHSADEASARIAGLLRGERTTREAVDPVWAAAEQMLELVHRQCARGPVVLAVADLQWADEPTLLLWNRLARAANQIPLLLLGEARPLPQRVELDRLRDLVIERNGVLLDLGPLDPADVTELARRLAGGVPGPRLQATLRSAGGNPLYIGQVVEALVLDRLVQVRGKTAELNGDVRAAPVSVKAAIGSRLGFVPAAMRRILRMAALLGREFDAGELAIVTKQSVGQLTETLTDAVATGILDGTGDRLRFRDALIHQVLLEETPAAIRRALHGEIAHLLAVAGSGAGSVARHLMMVPEKIDEWALTWLSTTPIPALYARPQVSAQLLGRAVDVIGAEDPRWELLATRLTEVLSWLARDEQARQMGMAVVQRTTNVALASRMRIHIIRSAGRLNQFEAALPFCISAPADDGLAPMLRARLGAWSAVTLSCAGRPAESAAMAQDALGLATASHDLLTLGFARYAATMCGAPESRPAHMKVALAALAALPGHDPESMELQMMLLADYLAQLTNLARQQEAATVLAQGLSLANRAGSYQSALMFARAAEFCYRYGRWDEALVHLGRIEREFFDAEQINPCQGLAALIALRRADRVAADARLEAAARALPAALAGLPVPASPLTHALALRAEADGDLQRALELMSSSLSAAPGPCPHQRDDDLTYLVRLALDVGDTATAKTAAELAHADMAADGAPSRFAAAAFCQALADDDARGLLAVAAVYQAHEWLPLRASALEEAAVRLAGAGDAVGARSALTDAVRIYTDLGAAWNIRRADGRLRAYRIRRGPRSIHRGASTGWAALTPAEEHITRLVARGLSNPDIANELFLSRRTVEAHVSHIMSKLELRSRVDIARAVAHSPGSTAAEEPCALREGPGHGAA